ncbi:MAG: DUF2791 family P-loop domain-containing protein [Chloroflexi bacterium]|nr:DUF2791 family P-loop domain-containing protein [Chloroflexota bacterium]
MSSDIRGTYTRLISILKSKNVPKGHVKEITLGAEFERKANRILKEIFSLSQSESVILRIITGPFGSGKSHMIAYLHEQLVEKENPDVVLSLVDLGKMRQPHEFQFYVMRGLHLREGGPYQEVFRATYDRITDSVKEEHRQASPYEVREITRNLILATITGVIVAYQPALLSILLDDLVHAIAQLIGGLLKFVKLPPAVAQQVTFAGTETDQNRLEFVDAFTEVAQHPTRNARFEELARKMSQEGILTDILFKLFKQAGFKTVVILGDELEALKAEFKNNLEPVLTRLREFHDDLEQSNRQYPAIALVLASTGDFLEDRLREAEPALYSRWKGAKVEMPEMTHADIENLIYRISAIYSWAGYNVRPLSKDGVTEIRERLYQADKEDPTVRDLISSIMHSIESEWVVQT